MSDQRTQRVAIQVLSVIAIILGAIAVIRSFSWDCDRPAESVLAAPVLNGVAIILLGVVGLIVASQMHGDDN